MRSRRLLIAAAVLSLIVATVGQVQAAPSGPSAAAVRGQRVHVEGPSVVRWSDLVALDKQRPRLDLPTNPEVLNPTGADIPTGDALRAATQVAPDGSLAPPVAEAELEVPAQNIDRGGAPRDEPALVPNAPIANPPVTSASFAAIDYNGSAPPDTQGAIGPNHALSYTNGTVKIQTKAGGAVSSVSSGTFWSGYYNSYTFDPKTYYDSNSGRFIVVALADPSLATSSVDIAVSATNDPTGTWNRYRYDIDATGTWWADFPKLGFSNNWIVVRYNEFRVDGAAGSQRTLLLFSKADLTSGAVSPVTSKIDFTSLGLNPSPVAGLGSSATQYLVSAFGGSPTGGFRIDTVTGSVGSPTFTAGVNFSDSQSWDSSVRGATAHILPQLGTTQKIQTIGQDVANPVFRNGSIWLAHPGYLPYNTVGQHVAVMWHKLNPSGSVQDTGKIEDTSGAVSYDFPTIGVNANSDVAIGFSRFSASIYPEAGYAFRYGTDPPGTLQTPQTIKAGAWYWYNPESGSGRNRWGDYSATMADPANADLWTIQQYAMSHDSVNNLDRWGTWWASIVPSPAPAASLSPAALSFGNQTTGTTSATQTVTVTSTGQQNLTISGVALTGANSTDFLKPSDTCTGATLTPGQQCTIGVQFRPATSGPKTASVSVTDNATGSPHTAALSGTGVSPTPTAQVSPSSVSFGSITTGQLSGSQNVTISNSGAGSLTVSTVTLGGTNPGDFAITSNPCNGVSLGTGASCTVAVLFQPTVIGARTALLLFADNATGSPHSSALSGTGVAPQPAMTTAPSSLTFGNIEVGQASAPQALTVSNTGSANLVVSSTTVTSGATDFVVVSNGCGTVAPSGSCQITVRFQPQAGGGRTGTLTLLSNAPDSPRNVPLSGTGTTAGVQLTPSSLSFGSVTTGQTSTSQSVTVQNTGTASLTVGAATIVGVNIGDFVKTSDSCTAVPVAPNGSCQIAVRFAPLATGTRSATLQITSNATGSPHTVPLSGTGVAPVPIMSLSPTSYSFGGVRIGTQSLAASFTIANAASATAPLTITGVVVAGTNASDFAKTDSCTGQTLSPGQSCLVSVRMTPSALGTRTATLSVTRTGETKASSLSGSGIDDLPPDTTISTGDNGIHSGLPVAGLNVVAGTATDVPSGVDVVTVRFVGTQVLTTTATLACNATKTICTWSAIIPLTLAPGRYTVSATARDLAGNEDPTPPSIVMTIV